MGEKRSYIILTFQTTTQAMAVEKTCQREQIPGRLIPTPREISAGCGLVWRMLPEDWEARRETLSALAYDRAVTLFL